MPFTHNISLQFIPSTINSPIIAYNWPVYRINFYWGIIAALKREVYARVPALWDCFGVALRLISANRAHFCGSISSATLLLQCNCCHRINPNATDQQSHSAGTLTQSCQYLIPTPICCCHWFLFLKSEWFAINSKNHQDSRNLSKTLYDPEICLEAVGLYVKVWPPPPY